MLDKEFTFVLGARDPEMREIAKVLKEESRALVHAAVVDSPVHIERFMAAHQACG